MNKAFTKTDKIELDSNWYLTPDGFNGVVLTFHEIRKKVKKDTGEKENFEFINNYYFPRVAQALVKYVSVTQNNSESLEEVINKTDVLIKIINKLDKEFKQF
jgi:predicted transcriptional regulator